jgi:hypothetical protein
MKVSALEPSPRRTARRSTEQDSLNPLPCKFPVYSCRQNCTSSAAHGQARSKKVMHAATSTGLRVQWSLMCSRNICSVNLANSVRIHKPPRNALKGRWGWRSGCGELEMQGPGEPGCPAAVTAYRRRHDFLSNHTSCKSHNQAQSNNGCR